MRYFQQVAAGVETLPLMLDLYRQPELWDRHTARTGGDGSFKGTSDIWVRFRDPSELVSREAFAEPFHPVFYDAWHALPHLRPIVFGLMARLEAVAPSPVVTLNRGVAVSMAAGPAAGLTILDALEGPALAGYHHLPAARGDCLRRLGRWPEAAAAYRRAQDLTRNRREQAFFAARVRECEGNRVS